MIQQATTQGINAKRFVSQLLLGCINIPAKADTVNAILVLFLLLSFIFNQFYLHLLRRVFKGYFGIIPMI